MLKKCSRCGAEKPLTEYNKKHNKLQAYCRECHNQSCREYYAKNKEYHRAKIKEGKKGLLARNRKFIIDYLNQHPCVDCGETNILCLQFDHLGDKFKHLSSMINQRYSLDSLENEIAKCEVRCANCHSIKTAKQFGFYRLQTL